MRYTRCVEKKWPDKIRLELPRRWDWTETGQNVDWFKDCLCTPGAGDDDHS